MNVYFHRNENVKKVTVASVLLLASLAFEASAWEPITPTVTFGQESNSGWGSSSNRETRQEETSRYRSSSGTNYQYDLSKPTDRIRYGLDPAAKLRDQHDPRVDIDRNNLNQYGGGAYR